MATEIEVDSNSSASGHSYNSSSYYGSSAETTDEEIAYVEQLVEENGEQQLKSLRYSFMPLCCALADRIARATAYRYCHSFTSLSLCCLFIYSHVVKPLKMKSLWASWNLQTFSSRV